MASQPDFSSSANPLLLEWTWEWFQTAKERNSKGVTTYKRAYEAMKACPIKFTHPSQAKQLHGFGEGLCKRLTDRLKAHCEANGEPMPELFNSKKRTSATQDHGEDCGSDDERAPVKKIRKAKPYVPALNTGPYALILGLATLSENASEGLTKSELIEIAQEYCTSSFTAPPDPNSFYTAWNSMKTLTNKDLVKEKGRPSKRYILTDEGWEVAKRIQAATNPNLLRANYPPETMRNAIPFSGIQDLTDDQSDIENEPVGPEESNIIPQGEAVADESNLPTISPLCISAGAFTVEYVLDIREVRTKKDRLYIEEQLIKEGIRPIMKALELGDGLWVAKCKDPHLLTRLGAEGDEVMLDYIIERKRLDDLIGSLKDGRFHEQKFRLKKSGVKNAIYIIEEIVLQDEHERFAEGMQSAIASTQVVNGIFVKKTQKLDDSIKYIARMTKLLRQQYEGKPLYIIPTDRLTARNHLPLLQHLAKTQPDRDYHISFSAFTSLASKSSTLTLRDYYLKMLMCTRGISGEKALEIQKRWKTPIELIDAYRACGNGELGMKKKREMVSTEMSALVGRKKIGIALSTKLAETWA
ncbi:hypothetical protein BP6252_01298 [Coleophoma cylindrospora]|uniref:Crossover junction endonuclease MUS81 n=1 Tax=Coleophoma cylindrospora TaxID=1849047 RepID=A0A3D8SSI4_9HELO|nr:hypothetical protein BP6252_01298 [Coleophoma cylindrospora]